MDVRETGCQYEGWIEVALDHVQQSQAMILALLNFWFLLPENQSFPFQQNKSLWTSTCL